MKRPAFYFLLVWCVVVSIVSESKAQGTLDALIIPPISGAGVVGYVLGAVGWSFVPTQDILVTGIKASGPQFSFWQGSNQIIATFNIASPSINPLLGFTPIANVALSAGQLYFVSCQNSNSSDVVPVTVRGLEGASGLRPFSTSSYISQFASYKVSPSGEWSSTVSSPYNNTEVLFFGPNFQFQVVPEPNVITISILGFCLCVRKRSFLI